RQCLTCQSPLGLSDRWQCRPIIGDDAVAQHAGLLRERLPETDGAEPETSTAEGVVLVPPFGEAVQFQGRRGCRESPGGARDPHLTAGAREGDQDESRSKKRPS